MHNHFIESFKITKLWGYRDINLTFNKDVNVLIGPNGSGKTTVLNLLHSILSVDIMGLLNVNFEYAEVHLRDFKDHSILRTVKVDIADRLLNFWLDQKDVPIDPVYITGQRLTEHYKWLEKGNTLPGREPQRFVRRTIVPEEFYDELTALVSIVWLPVSRRLPVTENEEEWYARTEPLESVDLRLEELLAGLSRYHSILNAQLSEHYGEFERQVLSMILYSKEHDQINLMLQGITSSLPTEAEKDQLLRAFDDAGLLNKQMQNRINDHFAAVEESIKRTKRFRESGDKIVELDDMLVLPLVSRTKDMVEFARKLEKHRKEIFAPLHLYENTVNSFLEDKTIKVDESDGLKIESSLKSELNWRDLSSGEKQILILLTQALLRLDNPVVYIADEPELSLHVIWQEKLLESLVTLGGQKQIIVATHSPDIVGKFQDKVIDLGGKS